jgi:hypothetical protein
MPLLYDVGATLASPAGPPSPEQTRLTPSQALDKPRPYDQSNATALTLAVFGPISRASI